jgi:DNA gyrase subunit B
VGVSVVNALSEWCRAEIKRDGKKHIQSYSFGDKDKDIEIIGETELTGTKITFKPDSTIFTETQEYKYDIIQNRLRELAFLNKNVKIVLHDERNGAEDEFHYEGGINQFVEYLNRNRTPVNPEPIFFEGEKDDVFFCKQHTHQGRRHPCHWISWCPYQVYKPLRYRRYHSQEHEGKNGWG